MRLAAGVYDATASFPRAEVFGITQQLRRAAASVPSNIAEGRGHGSARDYRRFLYNARGSLFELQTQLLLAKDLHYLADSRCEGLVNATEEVIRIVNGLIHYLERALTG